MHVKKGDSGARKPKNMAEGQKVTGPASSAPVGGNGEGGSFRGGGSRWAITCKKTNKKKTKTNQKKKKKKKKKKTKKKNKNNKMGENMKRQIRQVETHAPGSKGRGMFANTSAVRGGKLFQTNVGNIN